ATGGDLTPSGHWPEPFIAVEPNAGPVMILIEYRIAPDRVSAFLSVLRQFMPVRRRDGAMAWTAWEDAATPGLVVETFVVESWLEHRRQHDRATHDDQIAQDALRAWHLGPEPPLVRHLVSGGR
ncbi:MAG: MFS transporter, partial [Alphaproteobacteria bacterium]